MFSSFNVVDQVADTPDKRKKGIFGAKGGDKEVIQNDFSFYYLSI